MQTARELPLYPTLEDKIDKFTAEVADLKQHVANALQCVEDYRKEISDIDLWFRKNVSTLADDAIKEFIRLRSAAEYAIETAEQKRERLNFESLVQGIVEAKFQSEAPELAKAIFEAIRNKIQPHALR